jgi:hypothetical protein
VPDTGYMLGPQIASIKLRLGQVPGTGRGTDGWEYIELFADGGGDYVLARNRGQSPHDRAMLQWSRDLEVAERP